MQKSTEIFLCYAREDEELRKGLEKQLKALHRQGIIDVWHDRQISPGTEWEHEIDKHLKTARIILLLISPDFMDSDYCYGIEMEQAMERHERREACVIPIILRPVYWQEAPFGKLQALPTDAIPVTSPKWHTPDEAFFNIAEGIRAAVEKLVAKEQGTTFLNQKHYEEALAAFNRALSLDANDAETITNRGETYRLMKNYEEALTDLNRAISLDANDAFAIARRGETHRLMKNYEEALTDLNRAISLDANDAFAIARRGETYLMMKNYEEALADFNRVISLDANDAFAIARWRETYRQMKRYEEAMQARKIEEEKRTRRAEKKRRQVEEEQARKEERHRHVGEVVQFRGPQESVRTPPPFSPFKSSLMLDSLLLRVREKPQVSRGGGRISRRKVLVGLVAGGLVVAGSGITWQFLNPTPSPPPSPYTYRGHSNMVNSVAWSPDGKRIASGSYDTTVQVWDAADGGHAYTYHGHSDTVNSVAWSPDDKRIASGSDDDTVQVWHVA